MSFEAAFHLTEILLGFALLQQSAEHLAGERDARLLFSMRTVLSLLLMLGVAPASTSLALIVFGILLLRRYDGPYNGGSDRMGLLVLICLTLAHWLPEPYWREAAFGYLAIQLVLSYVLSGAVKIVNPDWRSGLALTDVFAFSAYPVSARVRLFSERPRLLWAMSWGVMLFELAFPLALIAQPALVLALMIAAAFHAANACLFGLNRFVWAWLAAYPSILFLQNRIFPTDLS